VFHFLIKRCIMRFSSPGVSSITQCPAVGISSGKISFFYRILYYCSAFIKRNNPFVCSKFTAEIFFSTCGVLAPSYSNTDMVPTVYF
jgi:hypothetical protein